LAHPNPKTNPEQHKIALSSPELVGLADTNPGKVSQTIGFHEKLEAGAFYRNLEF
jgi:hypothetical protein